MSVQNGQLANATTFNQAFLSRTQDGETVGKIDLLNTDAPVSGPNVVNIQRNINALASALGIPTNQVPGFLVAWASDVVGLDESSVVDKIEALVLKFRDNDGEGHNHTGIDGQGPLLSALNLIDINKFRAEWGTFSLTGASGLAVDVTAELAGKVPGGNTSTVGVITNPPDNRVVLVDNGDGTLVTDAEGQTVYGRIDDDFLLSFFTLESGVETPHSLASTDVTVLYLEVFSIANLPTIPRNPAVYGKFDIGADIPEATQTIAGKVSTTTQEFAGWKKFFGDVSLMARVVGNTIVDAQAGANLTVSATALVVRMTGAATSIQQISGLGSQLVAIWNDTGSSLKLLKGAGMDQIDLPSDFTLKSGTIVQLIKGVDNLWRPLSAPARDEYYESIALAANVTVETEITELRLDLATHRSARLDFSIRENTSNKIRTGSATVISDGTDAWITQDYEETGLLGQGAEGLELDAVVDSGFVKVRFKNTHATNAAVLEAFYKRFRG